MNTSSRKKCEFKRPKPKRVQSTRGQTKKDICEVMSRMDKEIRATEEARTVGFERRLNPEKVLGAAIDADGELQYLVQWENCDEADLVPSSALNAKFPKLVIDFHLWMAEQQ